VPIDLLTPFLKRTSHHKDRDQQIRNLPSLSNHVRARMPCPYLLRPMDLKEFDYKLPESLIAAYPSRAREAARLLVLYRQTGEVIHRCLPRSANFSSWGSLGVERYESFPGTAARYEGERRASRGALAGAVFRGGAKSLDRSDRCGKKTSAWHRVAFWRANERRVIVI